MILIVESGATKTAWRAVCDDGSVRSAQTDGLSPTCLDMEHTRDIIRKAVPELNPEGCHVSDIYTHHMNARTSPMKFQAYVAMMGSMAIGKNLNEITSKDCYNG